MYYLESHSTDPAFNLALEQYVFDTLPKCNGYFMLWQNDNAIIVGRHQNTAAEINTEVAEARGIRVVRRLSGGGAVYHDLGNINFTFIADGREDGSLDMQAFCVPVVRALERLGVTAEISGRNDITIDGQKFSGNAQYRKEGRVMHHGTILFDSDLTAVGDALRVSSEKLTSKGVASVRARVTNVRPHLKEDVTLNQFWDILRHYMVDERALPRWMLTAEDLERIAALKRERYDTWEWNYGTSPRYSIQKERRVEGCGLIQVSMEINAGAITAFTTHGDYFGTERSDAVGRALLGCRPQREALLAALKTIDFETYYSHLTPETLASIILA